MVIMAHYDLELQQMDFRTAFLNGDLFEGVYMVKVVGSQQRRMVIWFVSLRSLFMVLSRL